jgi:plastocyanin
VKQPALGVLAVIGGLTVVWLVVLGALATYDAVDGDDSLTGQMWDMMRDMGGMTPGMGGSDMNEMMRGMMGGRDAPETTGSAIGSGEVRIVDFRFEPTILSVTRGTVVTWINEDSAPHTATGDGFDTGRLDKGDSGQVTFNEMGTFEYICEFHPWMEGRIVVSNSVR